jgi:hypothetical protein
MRLSSKRSKRNSLLAAPIVVTAIFTPACEGRVYRNPQRPQQPPTTETEPTATPDVPEIPTSEPVATAAPTGSGSLEVPELPPAPMNDDGTTIRMADGSCLHTYPPPDLSCPPRMLCNPGPPRKPIKVKCPGSL